MNVNICTGIENFEFINSFKIYPNPNTGEFKIEINITRQENLELKILNSLGQEVFSEHLNQFKGIYEKQLDLSEFPVGIYNLQLIPDLRSFSVGGNNRSIINKKLIIE